MANKKTVVSQLRSQAKKGKLANNAAIYFKLEGGVGEDHIEESVAITSPGDLLVKVNDSLLKRPQGEVCSHIDQQNTLELCRTLLDGVNSMVPAADASFIPDTLLGSVSFIIGDETETFYFEADEEDRAHRGKPIPDEIKSILNQMQQIENIHLLEKNGRVLQ